MNKRLFNALITVVLLIPPIGTLGQEHPAVWRPRILVTNDDGYQAPGLMALVDSLTPIADLTVVAPLNQQSGTGHGISFLDPITVHELGYRGSVPWYAVDARPATVVRVALSSLLDSLPDLVVAGINTGDNLGINAWLSGTVAAVREAAIAGLPGIAFSVDLAGENPYNMAAAWARQVVEQLLAEERVRAPMLLNVNLHGEQPLGIQVAPMSLVTGVQNYDRRVSPGGRVYLWSVWEPPEDDPVEGTDLYWFTRGWVTVTPLSIDQTDTTGIAEMEQLFARP